MKNIKGKRSCTISCVALVIFLIIGIYLCSLGSAAICLGLFVLTFDFGSAIPMIMVKTEILMIYKVKKKKLIKQLVNRRRPNRL